MKLVHVFLLCALSFAMGSWAQTYTSDQGAKAVVRAQDGMALVGQPKVGVGAGEIGSAAQVLRCTIPGGQYGVLTVPTPPVQLGPDSVSTRGLLARFRSEAPVTVDVMIWTTGSPPPIPDSNVTPAERLASDR